MNKTVQGDPSTLVVIAKAAHQTGDRDLERVARRELQDRHGIILRFVRRPREVRK